MKLRSCLLSFLILASLVFGGCGDSRSHSNGVYMLLDTSGTYVKELDKARRIINFLLASLNSGDTLAVARVETKSFSEKDIIAKVNFDRRPSHANQQKRTFNKQIDEFAEKGQKGSAYTDITGAIIQGAMFLNEANNGNKTILIFSDMQEELQKGVVRDFPIKLNNIHVVAVNVTKLGTDNVDPRRYLGRLNKWEKRVLDAGAASWKVINDLDHLEEILGH